MNIKIIFDNDCGYSVIVDGEVILECMGIDELQDLTIGEITEFALKNKEGK